MQYADVVQASIDVRAASARNAKIERLATVLDGLAPDDLVLAVAHLAGALPQGRIGVGWAAVADLTVPPANEPSLTIADVDAAATAIADESGAGSQDRRADLVHDLFARAAADEQSFLRGLLLGELRQGAKEGVVVEAIARATGVKAAALRRAIMLLGDLPAAARIAATDPSALTELTLEVGRPVRPMLASSAPEVADALAITGAASTVEAKLDGMRIQVHRRGPQVLVVTRSLRDVTASMPRVVELARSLDAETFVLDGEALAVRGDGRPAAFQDSMSSDGLEPYFFDLLALDEPLLDVPLTERLAALDALVPATNRVARVDNPSRAAAQTFADEVLAAGHEGVVVKSLAAPYAAGRRGKSWVKVKPAITLDLVVLAVEWGSGRRVGKLSNIHLGARTDDGFVMLGKTFKGMTDVMLDWQTQRFLELETRRTKHIVHVRPEQVVEVAIDGVQRSTRYPGGVALRFARVKRYRDDKSPADADTLATVQALLG